MRKKITIYDVLLIIIVVFSAFIAVPYVIHQFLSLEKIGDIVWNVSIDVVLLAMVLIVLLALRKLLNKYLS